MIIYPRSTFRSTSRLLQQQQFISDCAQSGRGIQSTCPPTIATAQISRDLGSNLCCWYMAGNVKISHMLDVFHRRWLRTILGISWRDHVTSDELLKRAGMQDLSNIVKVRRLTLAGHILRLPSDRPASVAMQWVPDGGKRRRGRSSKTWRQTFQEDLQEMRVSWSGVRRVASDQSLWKSLVAQYSSRSKSK